MSRIVPGIRMEPAELGNVEAIRGLPAERLAERDRWGGNWLHRAAEGANDVAVAAWLARGLDANARDYAGMTPLHCACSGSLQSFSDTPLGSSDYLANDTPGRLRTIDLLIAHGADVDATDPALRTPLMFAAAGLRLEVVRRLLAAGADPSRTDEEDLRAEDHSFYIPCDPGGRSASESKQISRILKSATESRPTPP